MSNRAQGPEDSIWRFAHQLENDIKDLNERFNAPSIWVKTWNERSWLIPTVIVILGALGTSAWYIGGLILDRHILAGIQSTRNDVDRVSGELREIKGTVNGILLK